MTTVKDGPFITDEEFAEGQPIMRRLFDVTYSCPLCGNDHNAETYVAHTTDSLDELHAQAKRAMRQGEVALPLLAAHMRLVHTDAGDYQALREEADESGGRGHLKVLGVTMTAESEISCDDCAARFESLGDLWNHMGIDPHTSTRVQEAECHAHSG